MNIVLDKQDLTFLNWSHIRSSSGTAGTFLKSESILNGVKTYYKLSNFDPVQGVIGHECINEIIVDRLLTLLGIEHLDYELIFADIEVEGRIYETYLCSSRDFKQRGESKLALDDYYASNAEKGESHYDFCIRMGWQDYVDAMIAVDYLILNRDRHGANIEVLRNSKNHTLRIAPLFDHGLSLLYSCLTETEIEYFDINEDKRCQNFIGSHSCYDNLSLIRNRGDIFRNKLDYNDREVIFESLEGVLSAEHMNKIWEMIYRRYEIYESL